MVLLWEAYSSLFSKKKKQKQKTIQMNPEQLIKEKKGTLLDVRTKEEFMAGNVEGSINIPLQEIQQRMDEIKKLNQPLVLFCQSGGRSGQAMQFLLQLGIQCCNAGAWMDVKHIQSLYK